MPPITPQSQSAENPPNRLGDSTEPQPILIDEISRLLSALGPLTIPELVEECGVRAEALREVLWDNDGRLFWRAGWHLKSGEVLWALR